VQKWPRFLQLQNACILKSRGVRQRGKMSKETVQAKIREILAQFAAEDVDEDQDIFATGLVNSLFAMQLVLSLEGEFDFEVADEDLDINNFNSVKALVGFVEKKTRA
jgi:methoxymalonate biosynthesis acyl carrier protein